MYNTTFFKKLFIICGFFILFSCDKDYNVIGEDLIGDNNFELGKYYYPVKAYNQATGAVQSDNLAVNALGTYTNPAFGTTSASFATQLTLASVDPTIGANAVMDSVVMTIPYFSTVKSTDGTTGIRTYELDSIYGASKAPFKLSVYESGYFMRDLDPATNFKERQAYYSNQKNDFDGLKIGNRLNDAADVKENDAFYFDPKEIAETTIDEETKKSSTKRSTPAMRLKLSNSFFTAKVLNAPAGKLTTNEAFKNYFRGLYFKVEKTGADDSMAIIDFKKAVTVQNVIRLYYKEDLSTTTNGVTTVKRVNKTLDLNIDGNTVNFLEQSNFNSEYSDAVTNFNPTIGDSKLYLKGGVGSLAVLELFGPDNDNNGVADELEKIRKNGWLINEANLVFHIDAAAMKNSIEPNRIYVYNLTNKTAVLDYLTDNTTASANRPKFNKFIFGGILNKEAVTNGRGLSYKVRITNQIKNLIKNSDSTNVKLGVVVAEDIAVATFNKLKTPNSILSSVPTTSVINPLGTILFGGHSGVPEDKRLRLEIIYTKPN
ncbi:DUF4270 domain-containing protein [Flavobacterium polysaccharolyticum]|uniref:DUF4270 domain-containing protein n=1 Tax=Flavobacterium polysaccharolyticum TaxID=3133148 RepID=A0ABU9NQ30_9FLAO